MKQARRRQSLKMVMLNSKGGKKVLGIVVAGKTQDEVVEKDMTTTIEMEDEIEEILVVMWIGDGSLIVGGALAGEMRMIGDGEDRGHGQLVEERAAGITTEVSVVIGVDREAGVMTDAMGKTIIGTVVETVADMTEPDLEMLEDLEWWK